MAPPQARAISLRNVTPSIPENPIHLEELKQDLARMRCEGLLDRPWALKREQMVRELLQPERPNIFDSTIRDRPELWTTGLWRDTYRLPRRGSGLSNRMEGHHEGRFMHQVDPKDRYSVSNCHVDQHRRLLEFMVLIVHPGDDHDRQHHFRRTRRQEGSRLGTHLPGYGAEVGKGGWETQIHPDLPIPLPFVRGAGSANGRRGGGLSDGQGDGRIPDHPGSGFTARHRRRRADSNSGTFTSTRAFADAQPEAEIHVQGAFRVSPGPVQGTIEPSSTGTTAKGAATGSSTGKRTGVGGQALRQHSKRIPAGSESIRVYGEGAGADRLHTGGRSGGDHPDNPVSAQGPRDGGTPGLDR